MRTDLFETPEQMPAELAELFALWADRLESGADYSELTQLHKECEQLGYTFEFYLDAEPYALRPIGTPVNQLQGFEDYDQ